MPTMQTTLKVELSEQDSLGQAIALVGRVLKGAKSEDEIRERLTKIGFDGSRANIRFGDYRNEGFYIALVMVRSPLGSIHVSITTPASLTTKQQPRPNVS